MDAPSLTVDQLSKRFGTILAVDDLSFTVRPGRVTGFLGPNGAGKTTTLRVLLGLAAASGGRALVGDRPYADLVRPGRTVGALLDASGFHPGRTGLAHLEVYAPQVGVDRSRCREVLELVGLAGAAKRRVGGYSTGMRQRLGLATALLGDPPAVVLDEPANGLDPEGIVWMRHLLRWFADQGRTVLISSHVLGEVQSTVDDVVIIANGRLAHASPLADLDELAGVDVYAESPDRDALRAVSAGRRWTVADDGAGLRIVGVTAAEVGAAAHAAGIELHQLTTRRTDLESVFLRLTAPPPPDAVP